MNRTKLLAVGVLAALLLTGCKSTVTDKPYTMNFSGSERQVTYTGEVENDKPDGKGTVKGTNASNVNWVYEGEMKNGMFNGKGKTTFADGVVSEGTYVDNYLTEGTISQNGKLIYKGHFEKGVFSGEGALYDQNGTVKYQGNFKYGIPSKDPISMGAETSYADWTYKVNSVETATSIGNAAPKGKFVVVNITTINNGSGPRNFVDYNTKVVLIDEKGHQYPPFTEAMLYFRNATHGDWYLTDVNPGLSATYPVVFDVPKDTKNFVFIPLKGAGTASPISISVQ